MKCSFNSRGCVLNPWYQKKIDRWGAYQTSTSNNELFMRAENLGEIKRLSAVSLICFSKSGRDVPSAIGPPINRYVSSTINLKSNKSQNTSCGILRTYKMRRGCQDSGIQLGPQNLGLVSVLPRWTRWQPVRYSCLLVRD